MYKLLDGVAYRLFNLSLVILSFLGRKMTCNRTLLTQWGVRLVKVHVLLGLSIYFCFFLGTKKKIHGQGNDDCKSSCAWQISYARNTISFRSTESQLTFGVVETSLPVHHSYNCPQNFRNLADWVYGWPSQFEERIESVADPQVVSLCLSDGSIIYVRGWEIDSFFNKIYSKLEFKFVLITGESDLSVPEVKHMQILTDNASKIIHWFGQNGKVDVSKRSLRFTHIPIGINCYVMAQGLEDIYRDIAPKSFIINEDFYVHAGVRLSFKLPIDLTEEIHATSQQNSSFPKLLLINYNPDTDRTGLRQQIWKYACNESNPHNWLLFTNCIRKGWPIDIKNMSAVYKRNRKYPFWLSPLGNGLDCHRTWEALYLDIIPIVFSSSLNSLYADLPVLIINDWRDINATYLRSVLLDFTSKKRKNQYNWSKLCALYWIELILSYSKHRSLMGTSMRPRNLCWRAYTGWSISKSNFLACKEGQMKRNERFYVSRISWGNFDQLIERTGSISDEISPHVKIWFFYVKLLVEMSQKVCDRRNSIRRVF